MRLVTTLTIRTSTSVNDALMLPASIAESVVNNIVFDNSIKTSESNVTIQTAIIDRLNSVIRALGVVAKIISKRG